MTRAHAPFRQPREPKPLLILGGLPLKTSAEALYFEIRCRYARATRNGAADCRQHLFIAPDLNAYLIPDTDPAADVWSRERWAWFVGAYVPYEPDPNSAQSRRRPALSAVVEGMLGDIRDHLKGFGITTL